MVPIDYRQSHDDLLTELSSLNGIYIPGDTKATFEDNVFVH